MMQRLRLSFIVGEIQEDIKAIAVCKVLHRSGPLMTGMHRSGPRQGWRAERRTQAYNRQQ